MSKEETFSSIKDSANTNTKAVIEKFLAKKTFDSKESQSLCNMISDGCVKSLTELNSNFKFMVNCLILQKSDAGLSMSGSCYWDSESDGNISVTWENATILCIVNVFGVSLNY